MEIYYDKNFLSPEEATLLFNVLRSQCARERRKSSFKYAVPRDEDYYGDPNPSEFQEVWRTCASVFSARAANLGIHPVNEQIESETD